MQGHELVLDVPPEPMYVDGDLTRLSQVIANLLNNSTKYTAREGRILLHVELQNEEVLISVTDNGVGIPPHMLTEVFDMFSQVDGSLENSQGGLGIGLNLVKRLVELHGGTVAAISDGLGRGSTFTMRLPAMVSMTGNELDQQNPIGEKEKSTSCRRVLVVDDNQDGAHSSMMLLRLMGNDTELAHDGLEAIALAESYNPDVILMDIGMPKLNGYDACRRIREQTWGQNMVIVACTGWGQEEDKQLASDAGFDLHVTKPIDFAVLEKLLNEKADQR